MIQIGSYNRFIYGRRRFFSSIQDFAELKRDFIEGLVCKALNEKIDFIGFDYERQKTGIESRSHLTPEAVNSLKDWFTYIEKVRAEHKPEPLGKSEWVAICTCKKVS